MDKAVELQNKISDIIYSYATCIDFDDPKKVWKAIDEEIRKYVIEVSREVAVEFVTQIDDTYDEETPFEERLKRWGDIFDKWKSIKEDK